MAKSKYSAAIVQTICDAIAVHGTDEAGYREGGISHDTFYKWIERHPEFAESVTRARKEFQDSRPSNHIRQARKAFADYLFGLAVEEWESWEDALQTQADGSQQIVTLHKIQKVKRGVPKWAIERILGRPIDVLEALQILAQNGWIPQSIVQMAANEMGSVRTKLFEVFSGIVGDSIGEESSRGLSPETVGRIRAEILGIDAPATLALPTEMGQGSEPS